MAVDVLIPVLRRPGRVAPTLESVRASSGQARELFIASPDDQEELAELERVGARFMVMPEPRQPGDYARKINAGALASEAEWWFHASDDLHYHPGWLETCVAMHEATGALVVGTNDLGNPMVRIGRHATHSLIHRDYLAQGTIDEPGKLLHEGYDHNCVDVEFVETAVHRQTWAFAREAVVEHLHWRWSKGVSDATYELGGVGYHQDLRLLQARGRLWGHREVMKAMAKSRRQTQMVAGRRQIRLR